MAPFDGGDDGFDLGNPSGFIVDAIGRGVNATDALGEYRELGASMRTQTWYRLYGQVTDTLARAPGVLSMDPNQLPDASQYSQWSVNRGEGYATQVVVQIRDLETGLLTDRYYTVMGDDPHTPAEAIQVAMDEYGSDDNESRYGEVVMGALALHVWQTVPIE